MRPKRDTAVHEAGHAVIGLWLGKVTPLKRVTIRPDEELGMDGCCQWGETPLSSWAMDAMRDLPPRAEFAEWWESYLHAAKEARKIVAAGATVPFDFKGFDADNGRLNPEMLCAFLEAEVKTALAGGLAWERESGTFDRAGCWADLSKIVWEKPAVEVLAHVEGVDELFFFAPKDREPKLAFLPVLEWTKHRYGDQVLQDFDKPQVWDWVQAVAAALLEKETLRGEAVRALRQS